MDTYLSIDIRRERHIRHCYALFSFACVCFVCIHVWIHIYPQIYAERDTFVIISHYSVCIYMDTYLSIDIRRERHIRHC